MGGGARDAENRKTDSGACDFQGGRQTQPRGHRGPSEDSPGCPKGPPPIDKMGFGNGNFQNVLFSSVNTSFFKESQRAARGGPGRVFRENLGPRGGPGGARGARATSRGGARDPFGGNPLTRGGPGGGARGGFFFPGTPFA